MKIFGINSAPNFNSSEPKNYSKKYEFIDVLSDAVKNPQDVQDCIAIPRGIFKAYIYLMAGSSLMLTAAALPQKWKIGKAVLNILSAILSAISAVYFAKPFAIKGLSPTVTKDDVEKMNNQK